MIILLMQGDKTGREGNKEKVLQGKTRQAQRRRATQRGESTGPDLPGP